MELELPKDVKDRLGELRTLSQRVEDGDKSARKELRKALRESAPEVISRASDIGRPSSPGWTLCALKSPVPTRARWRPS